MGRRRGRCYALGATAGGYVRGARNGETGRGGGGVSVPADNVAGAVRAAGSRWSVAGGRWAGGDLEGGG